MGLYMKHLMVIFLCLEIAFSQTKTDQKPKVNRTLIFSMEEQVRFGGMYDYIETTKKWIDTMKNLHLGLTFTTFGSYNGGMMEYNGQISTIADISPEIETWTKARDILTKTEWGRQRLSLISQCKYSVWQRCPELSYQPLNPDQSSNQFPYFVWRTIRIKKAEENRFVEIADKVRSLFEENNIDRGYSVFRNIMGYEDTYVFIFAGKNPADFYEWQTHTIPKISIRLDALLKQVASSIEETVKFNGWTMAELSLAKQ